MGLNQSSDVDLLTLARRGDDRAESVLVERYLPLVRHIAARFGRPGSQLWDDVYSAGCLGLARALGNFDPGRGLKISTYAVPVILGEIRQYLRADGAVKLGRQTKRAVHAARTLMVRQEGTTGSEPSLDRVAEEVGLSAAELALAMEAERPPSSLDAPAAPLVGAADDSTARLIDGIALAQSLNQLPVHLNRVVLLRYGRGLTQADTGRVLGLSQSQVSRREREAIELLRGMMT